MKSRFETVQAYFIAQIQKVPSTSDADKAPILAKLLVTAQDIMSEEAIRTLLVLSNAELTTTQRTYVDFETLHFLIAHWDVSAFSHDQSNETRFEITEISDAVLEGIFYKVDGTLRELRQARGAEYVKAFNAKPEYAATSGPMHTYLNHLAFIVERGTVNRTLELPLQGFVERFKDYLSMHQRINSFMLFMQTLHRLYEEPIDYSELTAKDVSELVLEGLRNAVLVTDG